MDKLFFILLSVMFCGNAYAATSESLSAIENRMRQTQDNVQVLEQKRDNTSQELEQLQAKLVALTRTLEMREAEQENLEASMEKLEDISASRQDALATAKLRLSQLTQAMVIMSRQSSLTLWLREEGALNHIHSVLALRSLAPQLSEQVTKLLREIEDIESQENDLHAKRVATRNARQLLVKQQANLDDLIRTRQNILARTDGERLALEQRLSALADKARDLRQLLDKLASADRNPKQKGGDLAKLRAGLLIPLQGKVIKAFGERDQDGTASRGLTIRGNRGGRVVAPTPGKVAFAGLFKGYGRLVVLNHGQGSYSLLSGLARLDVSAGQSLTAGEPLGTLPDKAAPELYFELRENGSAINPLKD